MTNNHKKLVDIFLIIHYTCTINPVASSSTRFIPTQQFTCLQCLQLRRISCRAQRTRRLSISHTMNQKHYPIAKHTKRAYKINIILDAFWWDYVNIAYTMYYYNYTIVCYYYYYSICEQSACVLAPRCRYSASPYVVPGIWMFVYATIMLF